MNGLALLIPIALLLGLAGLAAFFWALRSGQFEDLDGAAVRILIDDDDAGPSPGADDTGRPRVEGTGQERDAPVKPAMWPAAKGLFRDPEVPEDQS
jgi:cbb3-type cytochrome oxidase maturation protein